MCDARIRPLSNDTEIVCYLSEHPVPDQHTGHLRDYAYPGSVTEITWMESDRRNFHAQWPGACHKAASCCLPDLHRGNCVS